MALAEDIAMNAFYKAMSLPEDTDKNFKYWLLKVARNEFYDHLKKRRRLTRLEESEPDPNSSEVIDGLMLKEEYAALYKAMTLLEEREREAVTLFYFHDLTVGEIAGILDTSAGNAKVILHRARQHLKQIMEIKK
jgi:RNA polymerase sigma-70 factor (ECF subfamily)